ncbi:MAG: DUF6544 family protein [Elusimicrobiota bacterium]
MQWKTIAPLTARTRFTHNNLTITALLYFNEKGKLTNFVSDDRYLSEDGKTYTNYRWSTPVRDYKDFDGRKIPMKAEAIWHLPEGNFAYAKFNLEKIECNLKEYK